MDQMLETPKAQDASVETVPVDTTMDNQQVRDCAYMAGLMDGEGTFCLEKSTFQNRVRFTPRVSMGNTCEAIALAFESFCERYDIAFYKSMRIYEQPLKPVWAYEVKRMLQAKRFVELLFPYLRGKQRQAQILLEFIQSRLNTDGSLKGHNAHIVRGYDPEIENLWAECRMLNGGGRRSRKERDLNSKKMQQLSNLNDLTSKCIVLYGVGAQDKVCPSVKAEAA